MEEQNRYELEMDLSQVNQNERPAGSWLCCLPCDWLRRNSGFHKMTISVLTLLVTILLVASPVLFLISTIPGEKSKDCSFQGDVSREKGRIRVCAIEECSKVGSRILASMSWKANPCQDFYQFACGSWKEKPKAFHQRKILQDNATLQRQLNQNIKKLLTINAKSDPFQKLRIFYKSCVRAKEKRTSLVPMFALLRELGGYIGPSDVLQDDLTDLVLNLLKLNGAPLFDIYLDSDLDNSTKLASFIDFPPLRFGINLASRHYWDRRRGWFSTSESDLSESYLGNGKENDGSYNKVSLEERRLLIMEKILRDFIPRNLSSDMKVNEIRIILHFANVIAKVHPSEKEMMSRYYREWSKKMTMEDLERKFPFIRWTYLLKKFFKLNVVGQNQVFVLIPDYMETLQRSLRRFPSRVVHNGLLLIFATDVLYELVDTSSTQDWPSFCSRITAKVFGKAVSILYVRQFEQEYVENLGKRVTVIFNQLKKAFSERIEKTSWIDGKTKKAIFQKLSALQIELLSWSNYWNASYANSLMKEVQVHPEDFFWNVIQRYRQMRNVPVRFRWEQSEENQWVNPFAVNALYVLTPNTIIIPLALLTQQYFKEDLPLYVPYSSLGLILAHEIVHGFDLKEIGHHSKENSKILMSQDLRAKLEAKLDCFVKQFSSSFLKKNNFLGTNVDIQFDWNMTRSENMADVSGLQLAYQAWKAVSKSESEPYLPGINLSPRQLFFLNAAQTYCAVLPPADYIHLAEDDFHTPQPERTNSVMMNSPGFAESYECPTGSPMNPRKKCSAW